MLSQHHLVYVPMEICNRGEGSAREGVASAMPRVGDGATQDAKKPVGGRLVDGEAPGWREGKRFAFCTNFGTIEAFPT